MRTLKQVVAGKKPAHPGKLIKVRKIGAAKKSVTVGTISSGEKNVAKSSRKPKVDQSAALKQEADMLRQRINDLEEGLQSWKDSLLDELRSGLVSYEEQFEDLELRVQTLEGSSDNLFKIIDGMAPDRNPREPVSIKSSFQILGEQGNSVPIDGNAARIGGGKVPIKV